MVKKILITGSNGLLGQKIIEQLKEQNKEVQIIAVSKGVNRLQNRTGFEYYDIDISSEKEITQLILETKPTTVINCAAITNVDVCETQKDVCWKINVDAVKYIASACEQINAHLIQLSTDFIFDGKKGPYKETASPNPLCYYGESKLASESIVSTMASPWSIVRTVLVYGVGEALGRSNIVLWAIEALQKGNALNIVYDQKRTPTLAEDLADGCIKIALLGKTGVYNISGSDFMSIDVLVERIAMFFGFPSTQLNRISSTTLNQAAKRPPVTGFVIDKAMKDLLYQPRTFEQGLEIVKNQLEYE